MIIKAILSLFLETPQSYTTPIVSTISDLKIIHIFFHVKRIFNTQNLLGASIAIFRINPKYWERQSCASSAHPDQTPRFAASDQGVHSLPPI